jgi:transcriptional regulator
MHVRPAFAETDPTRIAGLITAHPFGLLVTQGPDGMAASHLPFVITHHNTGLIVSGHLAAGNAQCEAFHGGAALAIFSGPHAYVSPAWYRSGPAVPTWDYAAVHVHGHLEAVTAEDEIAAILRAMSAHDPAFDLDALPAIYRAGMFAAIRGFRLRAERVEAQWKMSQNRSAADRLSLAAALRQHGAGDVAELVAATLPES